MTALGTDADLCTESQTQSFKTTVRETEEFLSKKRVKLNPKQTLSSSTVCGPRVYLTFTACRTAIWTAGTRMKEGECLYAWLSCRQIHTRQTETKLSERLVPSWRDERQRNNVCPKFSFSSDPPFKTKERREQWNLFSKVNSMNQRTRKKETRLWDWYAWEKSLCGFSVEFWRGCLHIYHLWCCPWCLPETRSGGAPGKNVQMTKVLDKDFYKSLSKDHQTCNGYNAWLMTKFQQ